MSLTLFDIDPDVDSLDLGVEYISRSAEIAVLNNGISVPVTHWFDALGDECEADEADACVCGDDEWGWFHIDLENSCHATVH